MKRLPARLLLALIAAYQRWVSPAFPRRCRYHPTCSDYAVQAVRELGVARGSIVAGWRLLRCNPFSDGGIDDLADRRLFRQVPARNRSTANGVRQGSEDPHAGRSGSVRGGVEVAR